MGFFATTSMPVRAQEHFKIRSQERRKELVRHQPDRFFLQALPDQAVMVQLVMVCLRRDDGSGGFDPQNPTQQQLLRHAVGQMQAIYGQPTDRPSDQKSCYDSLPATTGVQFRVHWLYLDSTEAWDNRNDPEQRYSCPGRSNWYLNGLNDALYQDPETPRGIQIFLTENGRYARAVEDTNAFLDWKAAHPCSQYPQPSGWRRQKIHYRDLATFLKDLEKLPRDTSHPNWTPELYFDPQGPPHDYNNAYLWLRYSFGKGLAHEVGHSLNLRHRNHCPNHLMNSGKPGDYLMEADVATIHRALQTMSLRQYISEPVYRAGHPLVLEKDLLVAHAWRPYQSLVIPEGVTLRVTGQLEMPPGSHITIQPGGKLELSSKGRIMSAYEQPWSGVRRPRRFGWMGPRGTLKVEEGGHITKRTVRPR